jgi:hypothetical protein
MHYRALDTSYHVLLAMGYPGERMGLQGCQLLQSRCYSFEELLSKSGGQRCQLLQSRCYSFEELLSKSGGQRLKAALPFFSA